MTLLPETIPNGTGVILASGKRGRLVRVRRPKRDTGFDEPIYRIQHHASGVLGTKEWTVEELAKSDVQVKA